MMCDVTFIAAALMLLCRIMETANSLAKFMPYRLWAVRCSELVSSQPIEFRRLLVVRDRTNQRLRLQRIGVPFHG